MTGMMNVRFSEPVLVPKNYSEFNNSVIEVTITFV
jgi:hypothetical protein